MVEAILPWRAEVLPDPTSVSPSNIPILTSQAREYIKAGGNMTREELKFIIQLYAIDRATATARKRADTASGKKATASATAAAKAFSDNELL